MVVENMHNKIIFYQVGENFTYKNVYEAFNKEYVTQDVS